MNYRNRGARCPHGMLVGVISCPVCDAPKTRTHYPPSEGERRQVTKLGHGKERERSTHGYSLAGAAK